MSISPIKINQTNSNVFSAFQKTARTKNVYSTLKYKRNHRVYEQTKEDLMKNHASLPHGGFVIRAGKTGDGNTHVIEYSLRLDSNPEFTASVIVAAARATARMAREGQAGCRTMLDIPPAYLSPLSGEELRARLL